MTTFLSMTRWLTLWVLHAEHEITTLQENMISYHFHLCHQIYFFVLVLLSGLFLPSDLFLISNLNYTCMPDWTSLKICWLTNELPYTLVQYDIPTLVHPWRIGPNSAKLFFQDSSSNCVMTATESHVSLLWLFHLKLIYTNSFHLIRGLTKRAPHTEHYSQAPGLTPIVVEDSFHLLFFLLSCPDFWFSTNELSFLPSCISLAALI